MPYKNQADADAYRKRYREENRAKLKEYNKKYALEHKEAWKGYRKNWKQKVPEGEHDAYRKWYLKTRYKVTQADYDRMLQEQNGRCGICECLESDSSRSRGKKPRFAIDHDHLTGEIRGLLCYSCNVGLGGLGDTIDAVRKALAYLTK